VVELVVIIEAEEPISVVDSPPPSSSPPSSGQLPLGSGSTPPGQVTPGLVVVVVDGVPVTVDGVVGSVIGSSVILVWVVGVSVVVVFSISSVSVVEFIGQGVIGDSAVKQKHLHINLWGNLDRYFIFILKLHDIMNVHK
jgi:hypothetical protein